MHRAVPQDFVLRKRIVHWDEVEVAIQIQIPGRQECLPAGLLPFACEEGGSKLRQMGAEPADADARRWADTWLHHPTSSLLMSFSSISRQTLIKDTCYLNLRTSVPKAGNLHLAWEYAKNPAHHDMFIQMLCVSPVVFMVILKLIKDHPIFMNNSNVPQTPVNYQLAVTLYCMGRFGNTACLADIAREAGISEGSVEIFTNCCFTAIESLHDMFIQPLTPEEKEKEKRWMDEHVGFKGLWREGCIMYNGTIIGNVPSNLQILDYSHGLTGSAHDATAFEHTAAGKHPEWLFQGREFAWVDSAYSLTSQTIPVHKRPAAFHRENAIFDCLVSHLRVCSEHCMGALKGRFQCLCGLHVSINSREEHIEAGQWITVSIILHNLIIDVEGKVSGAHFMGDHTQAEEDEDVEPHLEEENDVAPEEAGEQKQLQLTAELLAFRQAAGIPF
ncbi:hypothetical protein H0H81_010887 [Sphagnurus paluster]|uniref:DDE Tnp4 domain-containing protein n=1 Tax=Sphagnurus paluster TaxID=117069 RepID=A0A9P7GKA8_9AGAR|nr:hypothetical protein H0H81_010887 [Sphagnurus paluster]